MSRTFSSQYSRPSSNGSDSSSPSEGTAMTWIMDHLYNYPERYIELPLRTTYILNSNPKLKSADFKMLMMEHIASLPSQPPALPHAFLSSFVKKCFPRNLESADFDQALTALDYLRNLEDRRKREIGNVMREAGVDSRDSRVLQLKDRMQKVDNLYARVLTGLRQWTLINELENGAYNRSNCIAMLNTLYPIEEPSVNDFLTHDILSAHRQYLWKCIANFEASAPTILHSLKQSRGGWESLCDKIHAYLRLCLDMIKQCEEICRSLSSSASIVSRSSSFSSDAEVDIMGATEKGSTLDKIVWQLGNLKNFRSYRKYSKQGGVSSSDELGRVSSHKSTEGNSLFYD